MKKWQAVLFLAVIVVLSIAVLVGMSHAQVITPSVKHFVTMNWTASASPNVSQYNIYRSPISGGPYLPIGITTGTSFTDASVLGGLTYYYCVTAVNSAGNESSCSLPAGATVAEIKATIPADAALPAAGANPAATTH